MLPLSVRLDGNQWDLIAPFVTAPPGSRRKPHRVDLREVVNAILYLAVQAMGHSAIPRRTVRGVLTPDERWRSRRRITYSSTWNSQGRPRSTALELRGAGHMRPGMELQFTGGTISVGGQSSEDRSVSVFLDDGSVLGIEGWMHDIEPQPPPPQERGLLETGIAHFVACMRGGEERVLTAAHARHVLDVVLKAYESIRDGRSHETETSM